MAGKLQTSSIPAAIIKHHRDSPGGPVVSLCAPNARGRGLVLGWERRSCMLHAMAEKHTTLQTG